jgi:hypothetical protein
MTDAGIAAVDWLAQGFVEANFPIGDSWSFKFPSAHAAAASELVAGGLIRHALRGCFALTTGGRAYIMTNRPDLDGEPWSDDADDLRDALSAKLEESGFSDYRTLPLGELSPRVRGELWNLGFIERVAQRRGWRLTLRGQAWLLKNLAA